MNTSLVDTHIHVWDFTKASYDWLNGDQSILNNSYSIDGLSEARHTAGVIEGVLVQAANNFEDTNWMLKVAAENEWISGVVGWVPLLSPSAAERALFHYKPNIYFKGVRHLIHNEANADWLLQDNVIESLKMLVDLDLSYDVVGTNNDHLKTALKVAEKLPGLRMVFDHLNQPPIASKQQFGEWGNLMKQAAQHKNFHAKISGLGSTVNNAAWSEDDIKPYIEFVLDHFGADRCFCGGDWPVSLLAGSYTKTWDVYKNILQSLLPENILQNVYSNNAKQFYRLQEGAI